ncbi:unnamed protein product [Fraxinus pennsylvanica]|uniref:SKP1 component POZ domain-containing protein n=1 Tax=Fraxinus pennsylvanica TaxID=56036 RepID=A0AAD1ZKX7_9LAMI|nr:unnamed protein product [Fraxinus pennsylvanica]
MISQLNNFFPSPAVSEKYPSPSSHILLKIRCFHGSGPAKNNVAFSVPKSAVTVPVKDLISKVESEQDVSKALSKFFRYHPINEFEPFLESLGLSKTQSTSFVPRDLIFLKLFSLASKSDIYRNDVASKNPSKYLEKTEFLLRIGYVENSDEMAKALKRFRGRGDHLQERFDCLVQAGLDYNVVSSMVKQAPTTLNQMKDVLEKKIDCLKNYLGYPVSSIVAFPSYLCYDIERIMLRFSMYAWLREKGAAKPLLSVSTLLACSDARFRMQTFYPFKNTSVRSEKKVNETLHSYSIFGSYPLAAHQFMAFLHKLLYEDGFEYLKSLKTQKWAKFIDRRIQDELITPPIYVCHDKSGYDTLYKLKACSFLMPHLVESLNYDRPLMERILASFSLLSLIKGNFSTMTEADRNLRYFHIPALLYDGQQAGLGQDWMTNLSEGSVLGWSAHFDTSSPGGSTNTPKTCVWLNTSDGAIQVEREVAMCSPFLWNEILSGVGSSKNCPISLPSNVNAPVLSLILDYCRFHQVPVRSNKKKSFNEKFLSIDGKNLCELAGAADRLQLSNLVSLTSRAIAREINWRNAFEIRELLHLPDDLTEEEKLAPIRDTMGNQRLRLWNRLQAKKREDLKGRERVKYDQVDTEAIGLQCVLQTVEVEERVDDHSVDELLSFINGGDGAPSFTPRTSYVPVIHNRYSQTVRHASFCTSTDKKVSEEGSGEKQKVSVTFVDKDGEEIHIKVPFGMSMLEAAHENDRARRSM